MSMKKFLKEKRQAQGGDLMKQLQEASAKIQEDLALQSVEGSAGGLVTVTMNGHGKVMALSIKPEALDGSDVESLEDLLLVAIQDAGNKADELQQQMTRGIGLPGF